MDAFDYREGHLHAERVPVQSLGRRFGTPLYIYSAATLRRHVERFRRAFERLDARLYFSVKSCPNLHILRLLHEAGCGFDIVSGGELARLQRIGVAGELIAFAGVGKTRREIREAIQTGVGWLHVESEQELAVVAEVAAELGRRTRVAPRLNPDIDPRTHPYTTTGTAATKFGLDAETVRRLFDAYRDHAYVRLCGLHMHLGSPIRDVAAWGRAVGRLRELADGLRAAGHDVEALDLGGGFPAYYDEHADPTPDDFARLAERQLAGAGYRVLIEPGRAIAANAGLLVTRVLYVKQGRDRRFVIVDAGMTELIRPALYGAYHFVWPVQADAHVPAGRGSGQPFDDLVATDVVGPVCENADFLCRGRPLPAVQPGDLLAVFGAGAYGMSMASQYNSRPRPAEVLVEGEQVRLIRRRETYEDVMTNEQ